MRKRKPYPFIPKDALNWKKVMDVTSGRGIAPFRKPRIALFFKDEEDEEYKENVPKPLKRLHSPYAPDEVASMLGLEDSQALYRWLEYKESSLTEAEYCEVKAEAYGTPLDIIYDGEWGTFIPDEIMNAGVILSHAAFRCWAILRQYARRPGDQYGTRECYPSVKTIAAEMGLSANQVYKYTKELSGVGLLLDTKKKLKEKGWGVINVYQMVDPKLWWKELGELLKKDRKEKKVIRYKKQTQSLRKFKDSSG